MKSLTVQEKIILHLSQFTSYREKIVVPTDITQEGIAEAIGVQRPHVSVEIKRMMKKGLLEEFKAHAGGTKRRKAYSLTSGGYRKYGEMMEALQKRRVKLSMDGYEKEMKGEEALRYLNSSMGVPYAIAAEIVMEAEIITKDTIENKKRSMERTIYSSPLPEIPEILGREEDMERIERWYRSKSVCLSVVGTAGIGKTALVAAFVSRLRSPVFWHKIGEWESLRAVLTDLADFLVKNGNNSLKSHLSSSEFDLGAIGRIFSNIDTRHIWVFDDYQKASEPVKRLFEMLLNVLKGTPVRFIVISRSIPDFYSRRDVAIKRDVQEIFLDGLSPEAARELLVRKGAYTGEERFREIYSFTGGHPLTLELVAVSGMRKTGARAYLTEEFYHRLRPPERRMLSEISVHRKHVLPEAFVRTNKDVETLKSLIKKGIVYYDSEERYFTHDVIKAFFREKGPQKREHTLAYKYYLNREDIDDKIEALYHAMMAEKYQEAENLALEVVDDAITRGRANEILSALNTRESDLPGILLARGKALHATGNFKDAEKTLKNLIKRTKKDGRDRAMLSLSQVYTALGETNKAVEILEDVLKSAESEEVIAEAHYRLGMACTKMADYDGAEKHLKEAINLYEKMGERVKSARVKGEYATVLGGKGEIKEAIDLLKELIEFFEERGDYRVAGNLSNNLGTYQAYLNLRDDAKSSFEKAALYGELSGHMQLLSYSLMNSANNYLALKDPEKALQMAEKARRIMEKTGDGRGMAILKTVIAEAHDVLGDDAERYYEDAEKSLLELGLTRHLGELYMERGDLSRDSEKKMEYYRKAMEIFKEIGYNTGMKMLRERMDEREARNK